MQADIRYQEEIDKVFNKAIEIFGGVDLLVNNAGVMGKVPIEEMPKIEWDRFMDTNLTALFLTSQTFIRHCLEEKKGGRCVNVLSKSAVSTNSSGNVHYMASKGAVA